jgi:hypothetical protein
LNDDETLFLEFISNVNEEQPTFLIKKNKSGKYMIQPNPIENEKIKELKNTKIRLENFLKPVKSMSSYKVEELENLALKFGIFETSKKYKKSELYEMITNYMKWE